MSFRSYLFEKKQIIDSEIRVFLSEICDFKLYPFISYSLLSNGKRLRPILVLLSAESVGGEQCKVLRLALAIELLHNASLILDDIIDEEETRREFQSLHKKWSKDYAILTAGAMTSFAIKLAKDYGKEITNLISRCILSLCEGEYMDISLSLVTTNEEEYLSMVKKKSASLFEIACRCGSIACDGNSIEVECLGLFGENFGMAYQLRDDLLDIKLSKEHIPKDLINRRITLPIIHFYSNNANNKKLIEDTFSILSKGKFNDKNTAEQLLYRLETAGSFDYCKRKINYYVNQAIKSLQQIKETRFKKYLIQLAKSLAVVNY